MNDTVLIAMVVVGVIVASSIGGSLQDESANKYNK